MIIDFHTHTFPDAVAVKVIDKLGRLSGVEPSTDATVFGLDASMKNAGVDVSVNLPVMTSPKQVESVNSKLIGSMEEMRRVGIYTFGGLHPDYGNYKEELRRLKSAGMKGIKLHPAYQGVELADLRNKRLIAAASELDLIVLIHAGIDVGIYDKNYAPVSQILEIIKDVQPSKFVVAHMGNWACWDQVESDLCGAPLWMDTAFTIGPITPHHAAPPGPCSHITLSDEQFLRIARKHGTDRILFATDCPWQDQARYVQRFRELPLTEEERENIFHKNAKKLLGL